MTLEEAIKHAEEVAEENEKFCYKKGGEGGYFNEDIDWNNTKCAAEHRQLAEWLKDYKRLLEQEPCEDAISRQAAIDAFNAFADKVNQDTDIHEAIEIVLNLPPVTPQPKMGHWIDTGSGQECSECREIQYGYDSFRLFCANCGSRMDGGI